MGIPRWNYFHAKGENSADMVAVVNLTGKKSNNDIMVEECDDLGSSVDLSDEDSGELGPSVNLTDKHGRSPVYVATDSGHIEAVKCLVQFGADINKKVISGSDLGKSPLHAASRNGHLEMCQYLLSIDADLNCQDSRGMTPLHQAATDMKVEIVQLLLLTKGNDANIQDDKGRTALHIALNSESNDFELINEACSILVEMTNVQLLDGQGANALHYACLNNMDELVKRLVELDIDMDIQDSNFQTPLHYCLSGNDLDIRIIKLLIYNGAKLHIEDEEGITSLSLIIDRNCDMLQHVIEKWLRVHMTDYAYSLLQTSIENNDKDVIKYLLMCDADPNYIDQNGLYLLHFAALKGLNTISKILLHYGADVNAIDLDLMTPLHYAVKSKSKVVAETLISHGALTNKKDKDGRISLHTGTYHGSFEVVKLLIESGSLVNDFDLAGKRPLHIAASIASFSKTEYLTLEGADPNAVDSNGQSPLHCCKHPSVIRSLINNGASLNIMDVNGKAPLHLSCETGDEEVVRILIKEGADTTLADNEGKLPESIAHDKGYENIVNLFKKSKRDSFLLCNLNDKRRDIVINGTLPLDCTFNNCDSLRSSVSWLDRIPSLKKMKRKSASTDCVRIDAIDSRSSTLERVSLPGDMRHAVNKLEYMKKQKRRKNRKTQCVIS